VSTAKALALYVIIAFGLALLLDLAFMGRLTGAFTITLWGLLRMYVPAAASALILMLEGYGFKEGLRYVGILGSVSVKTVIKWFLLAPLIPMAACTLYVTLLNLLGFFTLAPVVKILKTARVPLNPGLFICVTLVQAYLASITLNAAFALGEEIGWRGFLLKKFEGVSLPIACIIIGILWGLWHAPAIILLGYDYNVHRIEGVALLTSLTILLTFPMSLLRKGLDNVLPTASFHGAFNAVWGLTRMLSSLPNEELLGGLGALGILVWLFLAPISTIILRKAMSPLTR